ncbi:MAG TPA: sugar phosphate isomerase/epimerase [Blastocatellia bacterium]|nr:sugar phosphate isomerase/epimerase [Blastocatellia bacterium]
MKNSAYSRREFAGMAVASLPAARALLGALDSINSRFKGVQIGAITYSLRSLPANDIIPAMVKIGIGEVELMSNHCEALAGAPEVTPPGPGGRAQMTPEQQERMKQQQEALRKWRMSTSHETFKAVKKKFNDAGIDVRVLCFNQRVTAPDDEIEYAFQMAKALGVKAISSSSTVSFAKRVAPFADKHKIMWGGHGHSNITDPEEFATPQSFSTIMSFSKYIGVNLDIGHFTAANFDAVAYVRENHARITNLHLKDRKKNQGPNVPWGQGETPIKEVLQLMAREKYSFPANIEFEYRVPEGSDLLAEMGKCLKYCRDALA